MNVNQNLKPKINFNSLQQYFNQLHWELNLIVSTERFVNSTNPIFALQRKISSLRSSIKNGNVDFVIKRVHDLLNDVTNVLMLRVDTKVNEYMHLYEQQTGKSFDSNYQIAIVDKDVEHFLKIKYQGKLQITMNILRPYWVNLFLTKKLNDIYKYLRENI
ncbi:hypothetical protein [Spiroplasma sp. DGKH1]|uniref:hypothetical protein n=1 Tax=Spiroplasma sp. DGKH1 TaxID=3050074 RepID=UPI0034C6911A